jgi:hypothetical protein
MSDLLQRRALFVYEAARLAAEAADAPVIPSTWNQREREFKDQFLRVIERQMGPDRYTTAEAAHEGWMKDYLAMNWTYGELYDPEKKTHPDLVPFHELNQKEQDKDSVFMALCEIARLWIR